MNIFEKIDILLIITNFLYFNDVKNLAIINNVLYNYYTDEIEIEEKDYKIAEKWPRVKFYIWTYEWSKICNLNQNIYYKVSSSENYKNTAKNYLITTYVGENNIVKDGEIKNSYDIDLRTINTMVNLKELHLNEIEIENNVMIDLTKLKKLKTLEFEEFFNNKGDNTTIKSNVKKFSLKSDKNIILDLPKLEDFEFDIQQQTNLTFKNINFKKLKKLTIKAQGELVEETILTKKLESLNFLNLECVFGKLPELNNLKILFLSCALASHDEQYLGNLPVNIEELYLNEVLLNKPNEIIKLKKLNKLNIVNCNFLYNKNKKKESEKEFLNNFCDDNFNFCNLNFDNYIHDKGYQNIKILANKSNMVLENNVLKNIFVKADESNVFLKNLFFDKFYLSLLNNDISIENCGLINEKFVFF